MLSNLIRQLTIKKDKTAWTDSGNQFPYYFFNLCKIKNLGWVEIYYFYQIFRIKHFFKFKKSLFVSLLSILDKTSLTLIK